jgi:hypothetical protein
MEKTAPFGAVYGAVGMTKNVHAWALIEGEKRTYLIPPSGRYNVFFIGAKWWEKNTFKNPVIFCCSYLPARTKLF